PIHSGMWGGPVPDAATALARVLARLIDDDGNAAVPGLSDDIPELDAAERTRLEALPFDEAEFRRDAGLLEGVSLAGDRECSVYERLWHRPAVAVTALEAVPFATAANQLIDEARARVGVRVAPGQDPKRVASCVADHLRRDPPAGVRVDTVTSACVPGWSTRPEGPAFEAALRALEAGFGRAPAVIGCGGTIPFVGPFSAAMGGIPQLLLGLEDPPCNAHGENESLDLGDFRKAAKASAHLLFELAGLG
ncbi:MAG: peptidase dimerization domain-containing protein, partial [Myxococcota bacterium]